MPEPVDLPRTVTVPQDQIPSVIGDEAATTAAHARAPIGAYFGSPAEPSEVGTLGPYRILKELGKGGMGAVFLALDTRLNRKIALKVMLPEFAANTDAKERFLREARAAAQVTHDNVVTVFEADERDGVPYIAMQFLQGSPLDEYLKEKSETPLPDAIRIAHEAALGLAAAHALGLVHRDIKPANLWLEAPNGRVKVLDFGLAKVVGSDAELTRSGAVVGTPAYMSPEQARGLKVDHRTDLFSLGAVLYRLCTGKNPFAGSNVMAVLMALGGEEPAPIRASNSKVPESLAGLVNQLLAKKPEDRPPTAEEVARRLLAIREQLGAAPDATPPHVPPTQFAPPREPDPDARRLYLRARFHFEKRTEAEFEVARELYREALALDPEYAVAYTGLADLHFTLGGWGMVPPRATFPVARQLAEKAIALDPRSADAWAILGYVRAVFDWDWTAADDAMRQALAIQPEHQAANIKHSYLRILRGRFHEALAGMKAACERDPLSVVTRTNVGAGYYFLKQYDDALTEFQTALTMNPKFPSAYWYVGLVHLATGELPRAVAAFEKAVELSGGLAGDVAALGHALAVSGRVAEAEAMLARLTAAAERRYIPPFFFALGHLTLGRPLEGYSWLDAALEERDYYLVNLRIDSRFDPYRTDPRFIRVARAVDDPDGPNPKPLTPSLTG